MAKYDLYTALIGIVAVFFVLSVSLGGLPAFAKIFLMVFGAAVFAYSTATLYRELKSDGNKNFRGRSGNFKRIDKVVLLNQNGEDIFTWELYGKTSVVIGKDIGENHVDIDLKNDPYAAMVDVEHAVLNYADGDWYVEDLESSNGISIQKARQKKSYKLSSTQPCKLDVGDIIFVGMCRLKLC